MFAQSVDDVTLATEDELGDIADLLDGTTTVSNVPGFFRRDFTETLSENYGITQAENSWECRKSFLDTLDLTRVGTSLKVTFDGRPYVVMDIRYSRFNNALLILSR